MIFNRNTSLAAVIIFARISAAVPSFSSAQYDRHHWIRSSAITASKTLSASKGLPAPSVNATTSVPFPSLSTGSPLPTAWSTGILSIPSANSTIPVLWRNTTTSTPANATATPVHTFWKPQVGTTWQIELSDPVDDTTLNNTSVFDIDLFLNPVSVITTLHTLNRKVICYFSAGVYEATRPDAALFQSSDLGNFIADVLGERWIDTNSASVRTIMLARIALAAANGCDGIDPGHVDGYNNANGFDLTTEDAINYITFLADAAHSRGLAIGLRNSGEVISDVLPLMEWEINEQCVQFDDCSTFTSFIEAGKPVFHVEYPPGAGEFISDTFKTEYCAAPSGFSSILKAMKLNDWVEAC
jgi:hypothetical protein